MSTIIAAAALVNLSVADIAVASPSDLPPSAEAPNAQAVENQKMAAELSGTATVRVSGKSLADLLEQLSAGRHAVLRVSDRSIRYQRLTLETGPTPLLKVMERIVLLLSHGSADPSRPQYRWLRLDNPADRGRPICELRAGAAAKAALELELERPRREALTYLKDLRDEAKLPAEKRMARPHIIPDAWLPHIESNSLAQALSALTDDQLNSLLDGDHIFIQMPALVPLLKAEHDAGVAAQRARGGTQEYPPFSTDPDARYTLAVNDSTFADYPFQSQVYMLNLIPGQMTVYVSYGAHLGGVYNEAAQGVGLLPSPPPGSNQQYDISAALQAADPKPGQMTDLNAAIGALAKAAHVNIYAEEFLKPGSQDGMHLRKGTLPEIANEICRVWGLRVTKAGDDYLFWDRNWANLRQADVSDLEIERIRRLVSRRGGQLSPEDSVDLCTQFSWRQIAATLAFAVPGVGNVGGNRQYLSKRVLGFMSYDERAAAAQPSGCPISQLSASAISTLTSELDYKRYQRQYNSESPIPVFEGDVLRGRVHYMSYSLSPTDRVSELNVAPQSLTVSSVDGAKLWQNSPIN